MKLYRLLLSLYPARFREEYGGPLEQQFLDEYRDAKGGFARLKLWFGALSDLAFSIPIELAHELKQDLKQSLRVHARRPFVMTFTVAILALAIGGATGVFSVVNAVLIKSLPFRDADKLVLLSGFGGKVNSSSAIFHDWRTRNVYLDDAAAFMTAEMNVASASAPARVIVAETSFNFFSTLGAEPFLGRAFAPSEDIPGNNGVAVISHALWQQLYGGDPRVLGAKLLLNGVPMTVIGVARPGLDFPSKASVWTPTAFDFGHLPKTGITFWQTIGRIKSGLTFARAEQMYEADVASMNAGIVKGKFSMPVHLDPLQAQLAQRVREASLVLMAAIGFVLLIACANVANLLLTRTAERRGELVIRAALGASRARLAQQLLSESLLLSFIAAIAGLGIAYWAAKLASAAQPAELGAQIYTILDWRVLAFAAAIASFTGLLFGVAPAWVVRYLQPTGDIVRAQNAGHRNARLRNILIALQVALTLVLLSGSVTMGKSFLGLLGADIGFRTDHLVTVSVSLAGTREQTDHRKNEYAREVLARLRDAPGVESAAAIDFLPLDAKAFAAGNLYPENGGETSIVVYGKITTDFFKTMGTKIVYGREFAPSDAQGDGHVAILTENTAQEIADGPPFLAAAYT